MIKNLNQFLKIIAEPNRLKIIDLLKNQALCVCEIIAKLKLPQNLISHHLKTLKDAKIINSKQTGLKIFYSLNKTFYNKKVEQLNNYLK